MIRLFWLFIVLISVINTLFVVSKVLYYAKVDLNFIDEQDECQILTLNNVPRTSTNIVEAIIVVGSQAWVFQLFPLFYSHILENNI